MNKNRATFLLVHLAIERRKEMQRFYDRFFPCKNDPARQIARFVFSPDREQVAVVAGTAGQQFDWKDTPHADFKLVPVTQNDEIWGVMELCEGDPDFLWTDSKTCYRLDPAK